MYPDEKTTELDLNFPSKVKESASLSPRWTEHRISQSTTAAASPAIIEEKHFPWLLKLAAAVGILILSLCLF